MRLYVESSVYGKYSNAQDRDVAMEIFARCQAGRYQLVTSELVEEEIGLAPVEVRQRYQESLAYAEHVPITDEATILQTAYLVAGVVGAARANDALHVAIATVARCDLLTSFDQKHIINVRRIPLFNQINAQAGYEPINILFPEQVLYL